MRCLAAVLVAAMVSLSATGQRLLDQAAATPPTGGVQIWTSDVVSDATAPNAKKELKPISLVATRNGKFSGKVVVESVTTIKGLKVSV